VGESAQAIAASLCEAPNGAVLLGNFAVHHPQASQLQWLAQAIAEMIGGKCGVLAEAANTVGGYVARALPDQAGVNARTMIAQPLKAYVLLGVEPEFDAHDTRAALAAMQSAEFVVALSPFQGRAVEYAHALLPVAPFTETAGTFISSEGRVQTFNGVVKPLGETRPAWKVLRVLGNLLGVSGFDYESIDDVRKELPTSQIAGSLDNRLDLSGAAVASAAGLERVGEVPIYSVDALCRRAASLQLTRDAQAPVAWMHGAQIEKLQLQAGDQVRVEQPQGSAVLPFGRDDRLPRNAVRVAAATQATAALGPMFGELRLTRVPAHEKATA
jgi:NADH-quinone oxidoreductase subunit G